MRQEILNSIYYGCCYDYKKMSITLLRYATISIERSILHTISVDVPLFSELSEHLLFLYYSPLFLLLITLLSFFFYKLYSPLIDNSSFISLALLFSSLLFSSLSFSSLLFSSLLFSPFSLCYQIICLLLFLCLYLYLRFCLCIQSKTMYFVDMIFNEIVVFHSYNIINSKQSVHNFCNTFNKYWLGWSNHLNDNRNHRHFHLLAYLKIISLYLHIFFANANL